MGISAAPEHCNYHLTRCAYMANVGKVRTHGNVGKVRMHGNVNANTYNKSMTFVGSMPFDGSLAFSILV